MLILCGLILGLLVGSFLNVVIYRLPIMLERQWWNEHREVLNLPASMNTQETFNLFTPRSRCTYCKKTITAWRNIPLLSFILLRRKCADCKKTISWRYPLVELSCAVLSALVVWRFGFTWQMVAALIFTWNLLALAFIDAEKQLLPDSITLSLLWLGLLISLTTIFIDTHEAIIAASLGYLCLWFLANAFQRLTGRVGMANGDFKLLAALGAWVGWQLLPFIVFFAALTGAMGGFIWHALKKPAQSTALPFGPYLAIVGWIALVWGKSLLPFYERLAGG